MPKYKIHKRKSLLDKNTTIVNVTKEKSLSETLFSEENSNNNILKEGKYTVHERTSMLDKNTKIVNTIREKPLTETLFGSDKNKKLKGDSDEKKKDYQTIDNFDLETPQVTRKADYTSTKELNYNGTKYDVNAIQNYVPSKKYSLDEASEYAKYVANLILNNKTKLEEIKNNIDSYVINAHGPFGLIRKKVKSTSLEVVSYGIKLFEIYDIDDYSSGRVVSKEDFRITYLTFDGKILIQNGRRTYLSGGKASVSISDVNESKINTRVSIWEKSLDFDNVALIDYMLKENNIDMNYDKYSNLSNKKNDNQKMIDLKEKLESTNQKTKIKYVGKIDILLQIIIILIIILLLISNWPMRIIYLIGVIAFIYFKREVTFKYDETGLIILSFLALIIKSIYINFINKSVIWVDYLSILLIIVIIGLSLKKLFVEHKKRKNK